MDRVNDFVNHIIPHRTIKKTSVMAFAPTNIALCKYWGKRDIGLNLPVTSSLSVTLPTLGTTTTLTQIDAKEDVIFLNQQYLTLDAPEAQRIVKFLNLFRETNTFFRIDTINTIPTGAGLASSASGFAALVLALNTLYEWHLTPRELSLLARVGSGSACRSLWPGFVEWHRGLRADGMDSYAEPLPIQWPTLCLIILLLETGKKSIDSRTAMNRTVETSPAYRAWPMQVEKDLADIKEALLQHDFERLGSSTERNAIALHETMHDAQPAIDYDCPATRKAKETVRNLRQAGIPVYFTQDAGPNLKLLFERPHRAAITQAFSSYTQKFVCLHGETEI